MTESNPHSPRVTTPEPVEQLPTDSGGDLVCGLAGCETVIEQAARGHARRYCCTAHRKIARRQRRESANAATPAGQPSPAEHTTTGELGVAVAGPVVAALAAHVRPEVLAGHAPMVAHAPMAAHAPLATAATSVDAAVATYPGTVATAIDRTAAPAEAVEPEPRTAPIPVLRATGVGSAHRRLVVARRRWYRRPCRPYAVRGLRVNRARYPVPPLPSHPEWLWPTLPGNPPMRPDSAPRTPAHQPQPPRVLRPAPVPPPVASPRPIETWQPLPTVAAAPPAPTLPAALPARPATPLPPVRPATPLPPARPVTPQPVTPPQLTAPATTATPPGPAVPELPTERPTQAQARADARRDAEAVLRGTPIPGLIEPTPGRRGRGRRAALATLATPATVAQAAFLPQMREALLAALRSLASNRLRSLLTTVGIIAGVASVIVLVAMGDGMTKGFNDQWSQYATQITITPITGAVATGKAPQHLTDTDLRALRDPKATPDVATWSPAVASNSVTVAVGQQKAGSQLYGISENYLELDNRHMVAGNWFTDAQMSAGARQAVLGPQVVNALWGPGTDPTTLIGQPLRVGHSTFQIRGVVNSDGQNDNIVMVPLTTARAFVVGDDGGKLNVIIAKSTSIDTLEAAKSEIFAVLYAQHHVREDTDRDFNVTDNTNILNQQSQSIRFLSMFIVAIAAISLFVGGVGVANIMLVSVTERTREIGIRKAIGAPRRAIMRQFLSEAVMLTALGGLVGIILGVGLCELGKLVIPKLWPPDPTSLTPTPIPLLSVSPVILAFGVSLVIGLLAGGYPAYRASRLRPIEALRFE
jgi:ABC-type antimicrobial peptide transport system permease subunit